MPRPRGTLSAMRVLLLGVTAGLLLGVSAAQARPVAAPDCIAQAAQDHYRAGGAELTLICQAAVDAVQLAFPGGRVYGRPTRHVLLATSRQACTVSGRSTVACAKIGLAPGTELFFNALVSPAPQVGGKARLTVVFRSGSKRTYQLEYAGQADLD